MAISSAVTPGAVARVVGVETKFVNLNQNGGVLLPQRVALFGQGSDAAVYNLDKEQITSAREAGEKYGFGSPIHIAARELFPSNGDGVGTIPVTVYPLDAGAGATASAGNIAISGAQTKNASYQLSVNGTLSKGFVIAAGDSVASIATAIADAVNSVLEMPVIATAAATQTDFVAKWSGATGNDIVIEIFGDATAGTVFTTTQPTGGAGDLADLDDALAQIGDVWETIGINTANRLDTAALDTLEFFGSGRWDALTKKPMFFITGGNDVSADDVTTLTDARKNDRINSLVTAPGSKSLPLQIAARAAARIATVANENPPHDYARQSLSGILPGKDSEQWDYLTRNEAVSKGASTVEYKDGIVNISDTVTFYHPDGEEPPAYRYVVDIVKLQNVIFNLDLIFNSEEWDGAPLIPDDQPTVNPAAKQPKAAVAAVNSLIDFLALEAIVSDPKTAKKNTIAEIDSQNPKRLNVQLTLQLSGNVNIISVDFLFGFYFGPIS